MKKKTSINVSYNYGANSNTTPNLSLEFVTILSKVCILELKLSTQKHTITHRHTQCHVIRVLLAPWRVWSKPIILEVNCYCEGLSRYCPPQSLPQLDDQSGHRYPVDHCGLCLPYPEHYRHMCCEGTLREMGLLHQRCCQKGKHDA